MSEQSKEDVARGWAEALAQIEAENKAQGLVECPACKGTGMDDDDEGDCETCGGDATVNPRQGLN
jgi:DnaJ-class molecular chaperone